jgi:hypothetical protein
MRQASTIGVRAVRAYGDKAAKAHNGIFVAARLL